MHVFRKEAVNRDVSPFIAALSTWLKHDSMIGCPPIGIAIAKRGGRHESINLTNSIQR